MSTEFFNDQWRIPSNENQNKISNYSMDFDGTGNDSVNVGLIKPFNNSVSNFAVSYWIKANFSKLSGHVHFDFRYNGATRGVAIENSVSNLVFYTAGGASTYWQTPTSGLNNNEWNHIVLNFDGSIAANADKAEFWINGVKKTTTVAFPGNSSTIAINGNGFLGAGFNPYPLEGQLDQFCTFDYTLSSDQITQLSSEGYAFRFSRAANTFIDVDNSSDDLNIPFGSFAFWFYPTTTTSQEEYLLSCNRTSVGTPKTSWSMNIQNQDIDPSNPNKARINFTADNHGVNNVTAFDVVLNQWNHYIAVKPDATSGNTRPNFYVNGQPSVPSNPTNLGPNLNYSNITVDKVYIGRLAHPSFSGGFNGEMSNVQVFNTALSSTDAQTLYNNGKPLADMSSFTSLQGWWKLDDTATFNSGTSVWSIPDDSSNSSTGTSVGMNVSSLVASNINGELITNPMATSPKPIVYYQLGDQSAYNGANYLVPNNSLSNYVFDFDGSNEIELRNSSSTDTSLNLTPDASISAWIYKTTLNTQGCIYTNSRGNSGYFGFQLRVDGSNKLSLRSNLGNNPKTSTATVPHNQWVHVAATYKSGVGISEIKLSINGVIETFTPGFTTPLNYTNPAVSSAVVIGDGLGLFAFIGEISNVSLFNGVLTDSQIETLYNNGSPATDISSLSPVGWWKLNAADTFDGSNWTINDYGSGSNDGTSVNMTSSNLVVSDLQQTSGYSPYALDFGGITEYLKTATIPAATNTVTLSAWVKRTGAAGSYAGVFGVRNTGGAPASGMCWNLTFLASTNRIQLRIAQDSSTTYQTVTQDTAMIDNTWTHVVGVADGTNVYLYINGVLQSDTTTYNGNLLAPTSNIHFAAQGYAGAQPFNGQLSNCARWNIGLTQAQITEIYNKGVPSNLNTFSGTAPIGWWQLGSNSSFETVGTNSFWRCLDEIGTDYATSFGTGMTNGDITNGPGYSASGLGTSSIDIVGDAPYSTANGLSENMDVLDRVTDVPG